MFERSEFLQFLKETISWRETANGGQGGRAPFSAYSFVVYKRVGRRAGAQSCGLDLGSGSEVN